MYGVIFGTRGVYPIIAGVLPLNLICSLGFLFFLLPGPAGGQEMLPRPSSTLSTETMDGSVGATAPFIERQPFAADGFPAAQHDFIQQSDFAVSDGSILAPNWRWVFLPQGFLYHTYWASTAEPRLSTRLINDSGGHNSIDSQIGGRFGIVRFGNPDLDEGFQLDILGGANLRQNTDTDDWDMTGTDYRFDLPITYRRGQHAWKFGFYHVSSHMGDEFLKYNPSVSRIDYFRHSLYLGYSYFVVPELRLYGELDYAFVQDFAEPWHIQFGFDWGPVCPTGLRGAPFLAANVHLREELNFSGNVSVQTGWAWKGEGRGAGTLRTGFHYYNGGSPQFSFYRENEQQVGWGLWYDY